MHAKNRQNIQRLFDGLGIGTVVHFRKLIDEAFESLPNVAMSNQARVDALADELTKLSPAYMTEVAREQALIQSRRRREIHARRVEPFNVEDIVKEVEPQVAESAVEVEADESLMEDIEDGVYIDDDRDYFAAQSQEVKFCSNSILTASPPRV